MGKPVSLLDGLSFKLLSFVLLDILVFSADGNGMISKKSQSTHFRFWAAVHILDESRHSYCEVQRLNLFLIVELLK